MNEATTALVKAVEEALDSGVGKQAIEELKALDKSTASIETQLQEACRFLGLEWPLQLDREELLAGIHDDNPGEWLPRQEWVLRWILKRMKNEGQGQWSTESFCSHTASWKILALACAKLIPRITAGILHETGFEAILQKSLAGLAKLSLPDQKDALSGSSEDGSPRPTKRRRTENGEQAVEEPQPLQDILDPMATLIAVLIRMSANVWLQKDEGIKLSKNLLRLCIRFPPLNAFDVLGSCLTALCKVQLLDIDHLVLPMLDLFDLQEPVFDDDPKMREFQIAFAKSIMVPTLQLLDDPQRRLTSALHARLKILLHQGFYAPAQAIYSEQKVGEDAVKHFKDMTNAAVFAIECSPEVLTTRLRSFVKYAIADTETESTKQRIQAIRWVEPLILHVRECLNNLVGSNKMQQTQFMAFMEGLLSQLEKKALRLSPGILTEMARNDCGLLSEEDPYDIGWGLLSICIDTNPRFAIDAVAEHDGNTLLRQVSNALRRASAPLNGLKRSIIVAICQAFVRTRRLSTFFEHWMSELRSDANKSIDDPWQDDWTIVELGSTLRESLLHLQVLNELEKLLKNHDSLRDASKGTSDGLPLLIQIRCLLSALESNDSDSRSVQLCKNALHQIISILNTDHLPSATQAWHIAVAALQIGGNPVASIQDANQVLKLTENLNSVQSQNEAADSNTRLVLLLQLQYRQSFLKFNGDPKMNEQNGNASRAVPLQHFFGKIDQPVANEKRNVPLRTTEIANLPPKTLHVVLFYQLLANVDAGLSAPSSLLNLLDPVFETVRQQSTTCHPNEDTDSERYGIQWVHAWQILVRMSSRIGDKALHSHLSKIHVQYLDSFLEGLESGNNSFDETQLDHFVFFASCLLQLGFSGLNSQHKRKIVEGLCLLLKKADSDNGVGSASTHINILKPMLSMLTVLSRNSPVLQTYIKNYGLHDAIMLKSGRQDMNPASSLPSLVVSLHTLFDRDEVESRNRTNKYVEECDVFMNMSSSDRAHEIMVRAEQIRDNSSEQAADLIFLYLQLIRKKEDKSEEVKLAITRCMNRILTRLEREIDGVYYLHLIKTMHRILQNHQKSVIQWHADEVMATIAITTRPHSIKIEDCDFDLARHLFTALCRLFATLIANHRKRLGGRFHLILAATKSMMNCLFVPYKPQDDTRPAWLTQFPGQPLLPEHAGAVSRIITSLSDPTASAAARSSKSKGNNLNDAVKAAKAHNARFLRFAIIDFCNCQVQGRLVPEMRTALNPGLYSIMDILKPELRTNVNQRLDTNGKGIFKAFYEDYKRQKEQHRA